MIDIQFYLKKDLAPLLIQANAALIEKIQNDYLNAEKTVFDFLWNRCIFLNDDIENKKKIFGHYESKYREALYDSVQKEIILEFSKALGASQEELLEDERAFARWFDFDALADRCRYQISSTEFEFSFIINRLSLVLADMPPQSRLAPLNFFKELAQSYNGNQRIRITALEAILKILSPEISIDAEVFHYLARSTLKDVWIQCRAIDILKQLDLSFFRKIVEERLGSYGTDPDLFVRQHIVSLLEESDFTFDSSFYSKIMDDPSDFVRQSLCEKMKFLPKKIIHELLEDPSPPVRAMTLLKMNQELSFEEKCDLLKLRIEKEGDDYVLKIALKCVVDGFNDISASQKSVWMQTFKPMLSALVCSANSIPIRRKAAQTRELLWCEENELLTSTTHKLLSFLKKAPYQKEILLPSALQQGWSEDELGRLISIVAQFNFDYELIKTSKGYKIYRGNRLRFRWWRFFYEGLHPKTDKREGIKHTVGRHYKGTLQIPSAILADLSDTQVPGEPLYIPEEDGHRAFLPLLDPILSTLTIGKKTKFYTSEGITTVTPPSRWWQRIKAKLKITFCFSSIAKLRNWTQATYWTPSSYLHELQKLGFEFSFRSHQKEYVEDHTVTRFFPAFAIFPDWDTLSALVLSPYKLHPLSFIVFLFLVYIYFFWNHINAFRTFKKARKNIFLVIGGWGTRGKSSTERLKGALIAGLGFSLFSKTTGCEAMITLAGPFQKMRTLLLYRPYNKATIWEQAETTILAEKFAKNVLLWECMGLRDNYVKIMQEEWMEDIVSTITNAFPDHEDKQGPAGYNIAEVMTYFIQPGGYLITSEVQMLPYFDEAAFQKGTRLHSVGWFEEGLLTPDIMSRFPYIEHPQNVALLIEMGKGFSVPKSFILKELADNVIPDIGVLKVYVPATVNSRTLQLFNGMSANEKYSCLKNWKLLNFDKEFTTGTWITTFINNRSDRVQRSRAFAQLIVEDISADKHFIVGSNIQGFLKFISQEWHKHLKILPLSTLTLDFLNSYAHKLRVCMTTEDLNVRLKAMGVISYDGDPYDIVKLGRFLKKESYPCADAVLSFHKVNIESINDYNKILDIINKPGKQKQIEEILTKWFMSKFILVENKDLTGDALSLWISNHTPPFYLNKIMGMQNIKGPGLELIHEWENWEKCYKAGLLLFNPLPQKVRQGFHNFLDIPEFGFLEKQYLETLVNNKEILKKYRSECESLKAHIENAYDNKKVANIKKISLFKNMVRNFFDIDSSLKRHRIADQVYNDLSCHRISFLRATAELKKLEKANYE